MLKKSLNFSKKSHADYLVMHLLVKNALVNMSAKEGVLKIH